MDSLFIRLLLRWFASHNCPDNLPCDPWAQEVHKKEVSTINNQRMPLMQTRPKIPRLPMAGRIEN